MEEKYELVVDYGKPYSEFHKTKKSLKDALIKLKKYYDKNSDTLGYMDITIYENGKDVTDKMFKEFKI
jgi:hypothetical protein